MLCLESNSLLDLELITPSLTKEIQSELTTNLNRLKNSWWLSGKQKKVKLWEELCTEIQKIINPPQNGNNNNEVEVLKNIKEKIIDWQKKNAALLNTPRGLFFFCIQTTNICIQTTNSCYVLDEIVSKINDNQFKSKLKEDLPSNVQAKNQIDSFLLPLKDELIMLEKSQRNKMVFRKKIEALKEIIRLAGKFKLEDVVLTNQHIRKIATEISDFIVANEHALTTRPPLFFWGNAKRTLEKAETFVDRLLEFGYTLEPKLPKEEKAALSLDSSVK